MRPRSSVLLVTGDMKYPNFTSDSEAVPHRVKRLCTEICSQGRTTAKPPISILSVQTFVSFSMCSSSQNVNFWPAKFFCTHIPFQLPLLLQNLAWKSGVDFHMYTDDTNIGKTQIWYIHISILYYTYMYSTGERTSNIGQHFCLSLLPPSDFYENFCVNYTEQLSALAISVVATRPVTRLNSKTPGQRPGQAIVIPLLCDPSVQ